MRRKTFSSFWASMRLLTCFTALSVIASAMDVALPFSLRRVPPRGGFALDPLLAVVMERGLDRVLCQHRAVDLHGRELQLVHDVGVFDLGRLVHRPALQPLGGQAGRSDGAAAAEGLEL